MSAFDHALQQSGIKVVVVDDDRLQRAYISAILRKLGYEPHEADNGDTALRLMTDLNVQILICDLDMPGLDGIELTRRIRARQTGFYIHILMVTGRNQRPERERALEAGVDDFMAKPLDTVSLTARIRSVRRLIEHEEILAERERNLVAAKERIESDLRAAADAQRRMLPEPLVQIGRCRFHSALLASNFLAGDMFGYFELAPGFLGFYAIDVAGHGVHASLMSVALGHMLTAELFRQRALDAQGRPDPAALVRFLNRHFWRSDGEEYFTMFCAVLDQGANTLHFCQAGYPSGFMLGPGGACHPVGRGGYPVALMPDVDFETDRIEFPSDHLLVLVSDGALEAEDAAGRPFDDHGVQAFLTATNREASEIPVQMRNALLQWRGGAQLEDDLSIVVCERMRAA